MQSFLYRKKLLTCLGLWIFFSFLLVNSSTAKNIRNRSERAPVVFSDDPIPGDTIRRFKPFLFLAYSDTSKSAQRTLRARIFYQKLKDAFQKTRVTRELFDLLFVSPSKQVSKPQKTEPAEEKFREHTGQVISKIKIRKLDLFGPSVIDTTKAPHSWLQKNLNKLHTSTRNRVIRKNLFLKSGESIDPVELADNERILRTLPFIRDARIHVIPNSEYPDSVDILVLVQDVLPYSVDGSFSGLDKSSLELINNNLAGLGHELSNEIIYNTRQGTGLGYRGVYTIPNISGMFINGQLEFAHTNWEKTQGINLDREFYTPEVRWAGGMQHYRTSLKQGILFLDKEADSVFNYRFHYSDIWGAYAFRPWKKQEEASSSGYRSRFVVAGRFSRTDYRARPQVSPTLNQFFHDHRLYLFSLGWSKRNYYHDRYLFRFGRTEDVPYGSLLNFTFGREDREFTDYHYAGLSLARGGYIYRFGYLLGVLEAGSFFRETWQADRRQIHLFSQYFSPLLEKGNYRFRHIFSIDYQFGDRRFEHEFLRIEERNIRGFDSWEQRGTQRFSLRLETITFTPLFILGFQFAGYGFADLSFLNNRTEMSLAGEDFYAYGLGFRIRNDNLTFNTFQLRFAIYPGIPEKGFGISISTLPNQIFQHFQIGKPQPKAFR